MCPNPLVPAVLMPASGHAPVSSKQRKVKQLGPNAAKSRTRAPPQRLEAATWPSHPSDQPKEMSYGKQPLVHPKVPPLAAPQAMAQVGTLLSCLELKPPVLS